MKLALILVAALIPNGVGAKEEEPNKDVTPAPDGPTYVVAPPVPRNPNETAAESGPQSVLNAGDAGAGEAGAAARVGNVAAAAAADSKEAGRDWDPRYIDDADYSGGYAWGNPYMIYSYFEPREMMMPAPSYMMMDPYLRSPYVRYYDFSGYKEDYDNGRSFNSVPNSGSSWASGSRRQMGSNRGAMYPSGARGSMTNGAGEPFRAAPGPASNSWTGSRPGVSNLRGDGRRIDTVRGTFKNGF